MARHLEILAPTALEYWAVRCCLPHACISRTGVRLARWKGASEGSAVVVCGLAGTLTPGIPGGTVLIPEWVGLMDGRRMDCDPILVQTLVRAARSLHMRLDTGPLLTASSLVVEQTRQVWSRRGFVAADMETGLLLGQDVRVAAIRVALDGPEQELSSDWLEPLSALLRPHLWREALWLGCMAPRYALRAAHVLQAGLGTGLSGSMLTER